MHSIIPARDELASVSPVSELRTGRLLLRQWRDTDLEPFAALNADPAVMELLAGCLSRADSDALARQAREKLEQHGFGLWAVEPLSGGPLLGAVGLALRTFPAPFTPCVELLWRLRRESWGQGYASEAARKCLRFAFEDLGLREVVAITVPANRRSIAVMTRIGMQRDLAGDFDHPRFAPGHPLCRHVLYRAAWKSWLAAQR
jgi:RimJ/RimL family protein N-acetyltransferase